MKTRDILRIEYKPYRFAVYQIVAINLGGEDEEDIYELIRLDVAQPKKITVPGLFLVMLLDHRVHDDHPNWIDIPTTTLRAATVLDEQVPF